MRLRAKLFVPIALALTGTLLVHLWAGTVRARLAETEVQVLEASADDFSRLRQMERGLADQQAHLGHLLGAGDGSTSFATHHAGFVAAERGIQRNSQALRQGRSDLDAALHRLIGEHEALGRLARSAVSRAQQPTEPGRAGVPLVTVAQAEASVRTALDQLAEDMKARATADLGLQRARTATTGHWLMTLEVLLLLTIGGLLLLLIRRFITAPAERAAAAVRRLADGATFEAGNIEDDEIGEIVAAVSHLHGALEVERAQVRQHREELELARDLAQSASRTRETFLENVTHELRTPLNGVVGGLELLRDVALDEGAREVLDAATQSSQRLLCLVEDLLELTQLSDGALSLVRSTFDVQDLVAGAVMARAASARERGLDLNLRAQGGAATVVGDPARLRRVVGELVDNALRFTHHGAVAVTSSVGTDGDAAVLRVDVDDTGTGVDPSYTAALFQPFTQASSGADRQHEGAGLGLAVVQQIVHQMGGVIDVEPRTGGGSRFWFQVRLPLEAPLDVPSHDDPDSLPETWRGALSTLVVDGHPVGQEITVRVLQSVGIEAQVAQDLDDACAALGVRPFQLVLYATETDRGARTILEALEGASEPHGVSPRLVAVTAGELVEAQRSAGWHDAIARPIRRSAIQQVIGSHADPTRKAS